MRRRRVYYPDLNQTWARPTAFPETKGTKFKSNENVLSSPYADAPLFDGRSPERQLSQTEAEMLLSVQQAFEEGVLETLTHRQRECFIDVMISCDTYDVVARRYGICRGSVQNYVRGAAQRIRQWIEKNNG